MRLSSVAGRWPVGKLINASWWLVAGLASQVVAHAADTSTATSSRAAPGKNVATGKAAHATPEPPGDLAPVIGKQIWYAPHTGCLDRLTARDTGGAKEGWVRRFPEREVAIRITDATMIDGKWQYRFEWSAQDGGGVGQTPAERVVNDLRFDALPTTFYQTCFFLDPPHSVAGFLRAQQPLALQRYDGPSAAERRQEIERIEAGDRGRRVK